MKIKTISRTAEDFERKTKFDIVKVHRNRNPVLHPFERAREYSKALVATKLDKIFAKPFIYSLDGHTDGVYCCSTVRNNNVAFISGACDGEVKVWDLSQKICVWSAIAHVGFVRGVSSSEDGSIFFSCGDDKLIKQWSVTANISNDEYSPLNTFTSSGSLTGIDHHWQDKQFATSGEVVSIWDESRTHEPIHSYKWGADNMLSVKYNSAEATLLGATGSDRTVCLYDIRSSNPLRKIVLPMNSNKIAWNPMEPMNFIVANEDTNVYSFDMRNLDKALMIHKDHVGAVMDVAFSPTGREFVSGGYDRTIRIFQSSGARSRDAYHTKRMQRVFCVQYSIDSQFIFSGSDDTNIRVWKSHASQALGNQAGRQERRENYRDALKKRFSHMPEIKRLNRDVKTPKVIKKQMKTRHEIASSQRRKSENRKRHAAEGEYDIEPERERAVIKKIE